MSKYIIKKLATLSCDEDRKHWFYFDKISKKILNSIAKQNRAFVQKQLNVLDNNFMNQYQTCPKCRQTYTHFKNR